MCKNVKHKMSINLTPNFQPQYKEPISLLLRAQSRRNFLLPSFRLNFRSVFPRVAYGRDLFCVRNYYSQDDWQKNTKDSIMQSIINS